MNKKKIFLILPLLFLLAGQSCRELVIENEKPELPDNPYDTIQYKEDGSFEIQVDSNDFLGLHTYVLRTKCAQPACHDGSFEPDFRTVLSSYSTTVYHPVLKTYNGGQFDYRVVPFDTAASWLHERITTDDPVLGRMPLYDTLASWQIDKINRWILAGAPDIFGNIPNAPNSEPAPFGIVAYENDINGKRLDTTRARIFDPMIFPASTTVDIWFGLYDDQTLPPLFQVNQVKFSLKPFPFDVMKTDNMMVESTPHMAPSFIGLAPYYLHAKINTADFEKGRTYYMRLYVKDEDHSEATEIPEDGVAFYLYLYFSFKIQ